MREAGVKIWRYQTGFMHQKVLLADDDLAIVGSVNFDFRSFMLNFELSAVVQDVGFAKWWRKCSRKISRAAKRRTSRNSKKAIFFFRLKCRLAALMSPEQ